MTDPVARLAAALDGRYRLERPLGEGGMAIVWLAHDLKHARPVAIKILRPELSAALGADRFLNEIRLTASLQHPHILGLIDSGDADGVLYYVMPYIEGQTLRSRLQQERQLPLGDAVRIGREVASALDFAHRHGVIHRDVKPENILLQDGQALVADFGIARAVATAGGDRLTQTGLSIGTPSYMSPEQAAGDRHLDARSDIYSLGSVVYEMLTGEPPFSGASPQSILAKRLSEPAPRASTLREVPAALDDVISRSLARAPADRFTSAAEFGAALSADGAVAGRSGSTWRPRTRDWLAAALVLATLVSALLLRRGSRPPALDNDLVAVTPFEILDPELTLWREGMGDVLTRYLDGAGPLRSVSPTRALLGWSGRPDRGTAADLGQRTGAGIVVFGSVAPAGRDSVRLRASVLQVARNALNEVEVAGPTEQIGELADSLGHRILAALGESRPIGATRNTYLGTRSLAALKAFLQGEHHFRRGAWDSAIAAYSRAIGQDSSFSVAYRRMAVVLWYRSETAGQYNDAAPIDYALKADALNKGLGPRDSLLSAGLAHAARASLRFDRGDWGAAADNRLALAAFEEAARRYPDPETLHRLGDSRIHQGIGIPVADQFAPFVRAIELDSLFVPAYEHAVELAYWTGQFDLARRYLTTLQAITHDETRGQYQIQLLALNNAPRAVLDAVLDSMLALDSMSARRSSMSAFVESRHLPDSGEAHIRLARFLGKYRCLNGIALAQRGRIREAVAVDPAPASCPPFAGTLEVGRALWGQDTAGTSIMVRNLLSVDSLAGPPQKRHSAGIPFWFHQRDSAALRRLVQLTDSLRSRPIEAARREHLGYLGNSARAYLQLLKADTAGALAGFQALPDTACYWEACLFQQIMSVRLLVAAGRDREAAQVLDRWRGAYMRDEGPAGWYTVAALERARLAERLGDRDQAVRLFGIVAGMFHHADPELQPLVTESREALARLTKEPQPRQRE